MKNSRESNNNNKPRKEIIMNIPNTNKPYRTRAASLLVLAAMLLPALAKAKDKAQDISCRNNLGQLQLCWNL